MCSQCGWDSEKEEPVFQPMSEQELKDISARAGYTITNEEDAYAFLAQERENQMREREFDRRTK